MFLAQTSQLNRESRAARRLYRLTRIARLRAERLTHAPSYIVDLLRPYRARVVADRAALRYQAISRAYWSQYETLFYTRFPRR